MAPGLIISLFVGAVVAGIVAALLGIGGGVLLVPMMTLVFHVPLHNALGSSLVAAVAGSNAAALWPDKRRLMDIRLCWQLAMATTFGATLGAVVALASKPAIIEAVFALVLLYTAYRIARPPKTPAGELVEGKEGAPPGRLRRAALGLVALFAGASSGLLGIGGGIIIVPALNLILHKPFKVSTATSNLLIGLTALTGAFTYFWRGALLAVPTLPLAGGAFIGALLGSALDKRLSSQVLRWGMAALLLYSAIEMGSHLLVPYLAP